MKKILSLIICVFLVTVIGAQENPETKKKKPAIDLSNRTNDHFLLQMGYTRWTGIPDSINTKNLSRSFNAYFLFDFPFKTNPKLSVALGAGIATDHILFSKTYIGIKDNTSGILFTYQPDTTHFKKTKLATAYLEAPVEFRYSAEPVTGKGVKFAMGIKVGTLLNAHTRNAKLEDESNNVINDYVMKEASKRFFNKTRLSVTGRIGYRHWGLYGSYQLTPLFRDGMGPVVKPFSIGLTITGL
ncbi:MAG TPA: outer membrane beta-barrel protein [Chitinophagaceae bacterium]|nr:outer membrane beta-barrel protein [Chitinophagaceae bacterium]